MQDTTRKLPLDQHQQQQHQRRSRGVSPSSLTRSPVTSEDSGEDGRHIATTTLPHSEAFADIGWDHAVNGDDEPSNKNNDCNSCCAASPNAVASTARFVRTISRKVKRIPRRHKRACVLMWIAWKFVGVFLVALFVRHHTSSNTSNLQHNVHHFSPRKLPHSSSSSTTQSTPKTRVLYIVTSLAEYNTGQRNTIKGQDRLAEVVLPVLLQSVQSMLSTENYQVDVYLILAYKLRPEREQFIRDQFLQLSTIMEAGTAAAASVGLQIWDDACPLGYDKRKGHADTVANNTRALARQHRYVIKDKLPYYDVFVNFEDDMLVTAAHVQHYLDVSKALERIRGVARDETHPVHEGDAASFFGPLTVRQLDRLIPGFVRVEVLQNKKENGAQRELDPIPLDYNIVDDNNNKGNKQSKAKEQHFDPEPCCGATTDASDVIVWETAIKALAVRKLPAAKAKSKRKLDWVAFLPGPGKRLTPEDLVDSYWSGELVPEWESKPGGGEPTLIAQQGGWMATRDQLMRWNSQNGSGGGDSKNMLHPPICQGSLLPPFDEPTYRRDGQESFNVEYWSGGYQLFTGVKGGCNLQRVVSVTDATEFSKHFVYHTANNKQKQLPQKRMVRADHLWAQLNHVRKKAVQEMKQRLLTKERRR